MCALRWLYAAHVSAPQSGHVGVFMATLIFKQFFSRKMPSGRVRQEKIGCIF